MRSGHRHRMQNPVKTDRRLGKLVCRAPISARRLTSDWVIRHNRAVSACQAKAAKRLMATTWIGHRHRLGWSEILIVGAARVQNCGLRFSEDFQDCALRQRRRAQSVHAADDCARLAAARRSLRSPAF